MSNRKARRRAKFHAFDEFESNSGPPIATVALHDSLRRHLFVLLDTVSSDYEYTAPSLTRASSEYVSVHAGGGGGAWSRAEADVRSLADDIARDLAHAAADVAAAELQLIELVAAASAQAVALGIPDMASSIEDRTCTLRAELEVALSRRTVELEEEAVAADALLETVQRECGAVRAAATALDDMELVKQHATLVARIEGLVPLLRAQVGRL